jgi:hypothetical protein
MPKLHGDRGTGRTRGGREQLARAEHEGSGRARISVQQPMARYRAVTTCLNGFPVCILAHESEQPVSSISFDGGLCVSRMVRGLSVSRELASIVAAMANQSTRLILFEHTC